MPTIISFILTPPDSYDVEYEHAAFKETTDCDAVDDRVEGEFNCSCNFPGYLISSPDAQQVIPYACEQNQA
jgi:hypothetical protein